MAQKLMKYNPAFLSDDELKASFVARSSEFETILRHLKSNSGAGKQHLLVHGPRGSGKTTLALRVVAEIRENPEFSEIFLPVVFPEELYEVTSVAEFWNSALALIGEQNGGQNGNGPLSQLIQFANTRNVRLLFVVENFDMLIESQFSSEDFVSLQGTLNSEATIQLLATACRDFSDWEVGSNSLPNLFTSVELMPLDNDQCLAIWTSITGESPVDGRIKALRILTGGNPRLLAIISSFGKNRSFKQLMDDLIQLIDDHTVYFKEQLDNLAPIERKVYLTLTRLWKPSTAREVSEASGLDVSKTSSLLHRLMKRGKVELADQKGRVKWYQTTERLFNIYYHLRTGGTSNAAVRALIDFVVSFYNSGKYIDDVIEMANQAALTQMQDRIPLFHILEAMIIKHRDDPIILRKLRTEIPSAFFDTPDLPQTLETWYAGGYTYQFDPQVRDLVNRAHKLTYDVNNWDEAERIYLSAISLTDKKTEIWYPYGLFLDLRKKYVEAEIAWRKMIELEPEDELGWIQLGEHLFFHTDRFAEAEQVLLTATKLCTDPSWAWYLLGDLYARKLGRYTDAEKALRKSISTESGFSSAWLGLARLLQSKFLKLDEAEEAYQKAFISTPWLFLENANAVIELLQKNNRQNEIPKYFRNYLAQTARELIYIPDLVEVTAKIASMGLAVEVLDAFQTSDKELFLQPIVVGLKLFLGQDVKAPAEIIEIGRDIEKKIKQRCIEMESIDGGDDPPPDIG
ncbi:MAG: tetratricopeptide repeat protein [bacterium]|nr:tetratricopeptide repeat protein [bacterium]